MKYLACASRGRNPYNPSERGKLRGRYKQRLEVNLREVSNTITTSLKYNYVMEISNNNKGKLITEEVAAKLKLPKEYVGKRFRIRKLTPRECFRLMDVDEENINKLQNAKNEKGQQLISNSQLYKLAGNSIVVSCMEYMFRNLFIGVPEDEKGKQEPVQLNLF